MTVDLRNLPAYFGSNTDFQTWVQGLHAQFAAVGLVQTGDTGQINPATTTIPSIGTAAGYEIWRFNDALQSTAPVFIKVEYGGNGAQGATGIGMFVTVGTATNGAGTLTGTVGVRRNLFYSGGSSTTPGMMLASYCCSDGSGLALVTNLSTANTNFAMAVIIDRARDGSGTAQGDGVYTWLGTSQASQSACQVLPATGTAPGGYVPSGANTGLHVSPNALVSNGVAPSILGPNAPLLPVVFPCGKVFVAKMVHLMLASLVASGVAISVSAMGGTHTVMPLGMHANAVPTQVATDVMCVLWE